MALPRSTVPGAVTKGSGQKFVIAVPQLLTLASTLPISVNLSSRKFTVGEKIVAWFDVTDNGGTLVIDSVGPVIGNKPTYTCSLVFTNPTASTVNAANRTIWLAQE